MEYTKYSIEESFIHHFTKEKMYRVKRTFKFGGIDFIVCTEEQMKMLGIEKSLKAFLSNGNPKLLEYPDGSTKLYKI